MRNWTSGLPASASRRKTIQQSVLCGAAGCIQDKIGAVLAGELRGSIDQFAHLRLDADIEGFAPGGLAIENGHGISLESIAARNDFVFTG